MIETVSFLLSLSFSPLLRKVSVYPPCDLCLRLRNTVLSWPCKMDTLQELAMSCVHRWTPSENNQMESSLLLFSPYPRCPERLTTPSSSPSPSSSPPSATTGRGTLSVYFGRAGRGTSRSRGSELSCTSVPAPASNNYRSRSKIGWRTCLTAVQTPGSPSACWGAG